MKGEKNMSIKFYKCEVCGNIVCKIEDSGMPLTCCGKQMKELRPGSTDGSLDHHLPDFNINNNTVCVRVGRISHPMEKIHHIEFIVIETNNGFHLKKLNVTDEPVTCFKLCEDESLIAIYALCNLHGIFVTELERRDI